MSDDATRKLLAQADISFVGTVQRFGATISDLAVKQPTAVVRVDQVLEDSAHLLVAGNDVTVVLASAPVDVGQQLAFFTNLAVLGASVALSEVDRTPAAQFQPHIQQAMASGITEQPLAPLRRDMRARQLQEHTVDADVIVVGKIIRLEQAGEERYSEHAPHYWRATLQVQHVEKWLPGSTAGPQVSFIYPASQDVRWVDAPKPEPRQQGVWILHATTGADSNLAPFALLHAGDFRPVQHLANIRATGPGR